MADSRQPRADSQEPIADSRQPTAAELVRKFGAPKKSLGQCFLTDPSILERIADIASVSGHDHVVEIGAGPGTLTSTLLARGCQVTAVEVDSRAVRHLEEHLEASNLTLVEASALHVPFSDVFGDRPVAGAYKLVANLPYNIASEVFFRFESQPCFSSLTLMFQREVANRFVANVGTKAYGPLAILSRIRWQPKLAMKLPPGAFFPRPKVFSAVVLFERRPSPLCDSETEAALRKLVRTAFQQRRKTVRNAVKTLADEVMLESAGIAPSLRPERITLDEWLSLAALWSEQS